MHLQSSVHVPQCRYSGIATLLQKMGADGDTVVSEGDKAEDWKARSIRRLTNPDQSQQQSDWLRIQLLLDTSIAASHLEFVRVMSGAYFGLLVAPQGLFQCFPLGGITSSVFKAPNFSSLQAKTVTILMRVRRKKCCACV